MKIKKKYICVTILIGKPNVGKSTLFNKLINKKISITSKKKYTTQKNIWGIYNKKKYQYIYIDTPGIKYIKDLYKNINNILNNLNNYKIFKKINLIILMIKKEKTFEELRIINKLNLYKIPYIIIINKIDMIKNKTTLLPYIKRIKYYTKITNIVPICAKKIKYINIIKNIVKQHLKKSKFYFKNNIKTIHNDIFIMNEIIREKTIRFIGDEIPYLLKFKIKKKYIINNQLHIISNIYVKKKQYIPILIGKNGQKINKIIKLSQKSIKKYLNTKNKIFLYINIKKNKKKW